eukprot:scaffold58380_cov33-Prasinocladus_malaysianus.AAC.1
MSGVTAAVEARASYSSTALSKALSTCGLLTPAGTDDTLLGAEPVVTGEVKTTAWEATTAWAGVNWGCKSDAGGLAALPANPWTNVQQNNEHKTRKNI